MMPKLDGLEVCRRLRADPSLPFIPIILVTARTETRDVVAGLEAGGDEYLTKPVDQAALVARVKSMLRIKALHDTVRDQASRLEGQAAELADWNRTLEDRVQRQVEQLERVGRLRRYLSPQVVELVESSGNESLLQSHRRQITVVFCDLRGFTAFSETAEPEEVMEVLHEYHQAIGPLIAEYGATLEHFAGDGMMVFCNDPVPCPDPEQRAVRMALEMRERMAELGATWRRRGHTVGFGVGIATGYATLGDIGFEGRFHYGAIRSVVNLAARVCGEADDGQILVTQRVLTAVEGAVEIAPVGDLALKGFTRPVPVYRAVRRADL
jgi:adenylate cyclase